MTATASGIEAARATFRRRIDATPGAIAATGAKNLRFLGERACVVDSTASHLALRMYGFDTDHGEWRERARITVVEGAWDLLDVLQLGRTPDGVEMLHLGCVKRPDGGGGRNILALLKYDLSDLDGHAVSLGRGTAREARSSGISDIREDDFAAGVSRADTTFASAGAGDVAHNTQGDTLRRSGLDMDSGNFPVVTENPFDGKQAEALPLPAVVK